MTRKVRESRRAKKNGVKVNFDGVEARVLVPEGEYVVSVEEIETKESDESGKEYLAWTFVIESPDEPKYDGKQLFYNTSLQPQALWNLRNLLETLGVEIPDGPMDLDFDEIKGLKINAVVEHEKYEGRDRARVTDFTPLEESEGGDGESDEGVTVEKKGGKKKKGEELEKITEDEVSDMSTDELVELVEKYGLNIDLDDYPTARKKVNAVIDALEEASFLES